MDTDNNRYNGFKNYVTWAAYSWITDDSDLVAQILIASGNDAYKLSKEIESFLNENNPLGGDAGIFTDILSYGINQVDCLEIAENILGTNE